MNEKTSKHIATKASEMLADIDTIIAELKKDQMVISKTIVMLEKAKSVAASALTQKEKDN
jgi:hypothetical protein